jgi:hypothetical protein
VSPQEIIPGPNWLPNNDPTAIPYEDEDDEEDNDYENDDDGDDDPEFGFVPVVS